MNEKSKALTKQAGGLPVWTKEQVDIIRKSYAPSLNDLEFQTFLQLAISANANPFLHEIWSYKIKDRTVIILARDYYRNIAQNKPDYGGHKAIAVYENDDFEIVDGLPKHKSEPHKKNDRGDLIGAYAIGWKEGKEPFFVYIDLEEYDRGQTHPIWNSLKTTMIKKCAEAQLLRTMYGKDYSNTYSEAELPAIEFTATLNKNGSYTAKIPPPEFESKKQNNISIEEKQNKIHADLVRLTGSDDAASIWIQEKTDEISKGKFSATSIFEFTDHKWLDRFQSEIETLRSA